MNENQFGTILEDINKKFDIMVEGQQCLVTRMDRLETKMDKLETKVDKLDREMIVVKTVLGRIEDGLNDHEKRIKKLENASFVSE